MKRFLLTIYFLTLILYFPSKVSAADFFVSVSNNNLKSGDLVQLDLFLNTENEIFNAVEAVASYPQDLLEFTDSYYGSSVINLWLEKPHLLDQKNQIVFSGITPGGFNEKNAYLLSLVFKAKAPGIATVAFQNIKALKHDGLGTAVVCENKSIVLNLLSEVSSSTSESILKTQDQIPPENFEPIIYYGNNISSDKKFLIFNTLDKGSGLEKYEVLEEKTFRFLFWKFRFGRWIEAESPYLLQDQKLQSAIFVRATDKAGNTRIASPVFVQNPAWYTNLNFWVIIILVIILLILARRVYVSHRKKNKRI